MGPQSTDEKLDKIAGLLDKVTGPMACVLKEIKASNRSRWIVLLSMASMVAVVAVMMWITLAQMRLLMDRMEMTQGALISLTVQSHQMIDFADKVAKTPDQKNRVESMRRLHGQKPSDIIKAAAQFAPEAILEAAREIEVKDGTSQK